MSCDAFTIHLFSIITENIVIIAVGMVNIRVKVKSFFLCKKSKIRTHLVLVYCVPQRIIHFGPFNVFACVACYSNCINHNNHLHLLCSVVRCNGFSFQNAQNICYSSMDPNKRTVLKTRAKPCQREEYIVYLNS